MLKKPIIAQNSRTCSLSQRLESAIYDTSDCPNISDNEEEEQVVDLCEEDVLSSSIVKRVEMTY